MTMSISHNASKLMPIHSSMPAKQYHAEQGTALKDTLTPEQNNTLQQSVDDSIVESDGSTKSNKQIAKDIALMQSGYQQQQKLVAIYMHDSTEDSTASATQNTVQDSSTTLSLTNVYTELYQLHNNTEADITNPSAIDRPNDEENVATVDSVNQLTVSSTANFTQTISNKKLEAYNNLMMPSTSSYLHLSA